jgi:hypothetical protein
MNWKYFYCGCVIYIVDLCLILLSIIRTGHAKNGYFSTIFSFWSIFNMLQQLLVNQRNWPINRRKPGELPIENRQILIIFEFIG